MKTALTPALIGVMLAVIVSFVSYGGYEHYRFHVHDHHRQQESENIKKTISFFSASVAGFYATDGYLAGLNLFPADNMVKRRIFHDIRNWEANGKILVMDRDRSKVDQVSFLAPDMAVAVVDENWFSEFQDYTTRRPMPPKNANLVTVRYYLQKKWGKWIVLDFEVFGQGEKLPPVPVQKVLKWR